MAVEKLQSWRASSVALSRFTLGSCIARPHSEPSFQFTSEPG